MEVDETAEPAEETLVAGSVIGGREPAAPAGDFDLDADLAPDRDTDPDHYGGDGDTQADTQADTVADIEATGHLAFDDEPWPGPAADVESEPASRSRPAGK